MLSARVCRPCRSLAARPMLSAYQSRIRFNLTKLTKVPCPFRKEVLL